MKDLYRVAEQQYGIVTRGQLNASGLTDRQIERLITSGQLVPTHKGVYRLAGSPGSRRQDLMAACLTTGPAGASHRSAGTLWGLATVHETLPEILVEGPG